VLSVPALTVRAVDSDDAVQPGDAILQAVLAGIAERTPDPAKRDRILDLMVTLPPLADWPSASLERLRSAARAAAGSGRPVE